MTASGQRTINPELLQSFQYESIDDAALDMLTLSAHSQYSIFKSDVERFKRKYKVSFSEFEKSVNQKDGRENFQQEDDLMAWKFAEDGLNFWIKKIEELENAF